jgi:hypothetical protein
VPVLLAIQRIICVDASGQECEKLREVKMQISSDTCESHTNTMINILQDEDLWLLVVPKGTVADYAQIDLAVVSSDGQWSAHTYIDQNMPGAIGEGAGEFVVIVAPINQDGRAAIQQYFKTTPDYQPFNPALKGILLIA